MQTKKEVTRDEFVETVEAFERLHGKELKELLKPGNPEIVEMISIS